MDLACALGRHESHKESLGNDLAQTKALYNLQMDVRVVIVFRPDDGFRVSVASPRSFGRVWQKEFESKHDCFTEVRTLGLLTAPEVAKVRASEFGEIRPTC